MRDITRRPFSRAREKEERPAYSNRPAAWPSMV
jgi:hypothetical protein